LQADKEIEYFYRIYLQKRDKAFTLGSLAALKKNITEWRKRHLRSYGRKVFRNNTQMVCRKLWSRFSVCDRKYDTPAMRLFLNDPESVLQGPCVKILKAGNTTTVILIDINNIKLVVKRYNIKNFWHGIKRAVRNTRAAISWRNAHQLMLLKIPTAKPVALLEKRFGFFRGTSYFISEYAAGTPLQNYFSENNLPEEKILISEKIIALLNKLHSMQISHGDLKASNILIAGSEPVLIDLDAMRLHRFALCLRIAQRRDQQRLLKNWQNDMIIQDIFKEFLFKNLNKF